MGRLTVVAVLAVVAMFVAAGPGAANHTFNGVPHVTVPGNPTCPSFGEFDGSVTFTAPTNGAFASGIGLFVEGDRLSWWTTAPQQVQVAIVKGGPNAEVYTYGWPYFSDGGLFAPVNPRKGKPYGLGSATFCFDDQA
jgi:hypothetical protein